MKNVLKLNIIIFLGKNSFGAMSLLQKAGLNEKSVKL